jgi:hypothetical protein
MTRLIAVFTLSAVTLTGCSSAPSNEFQSKLVEYEKCLDFAQMIQEKNLEIQIKENRVSNTISIETSLEDCKKYKP